MRKILPDRHEPAWLAQIHSATVIEARAGDNGRGDALVSDRRGLVLTVVTADCVPVLLAGARQIAAVHAGWRGLAQSILPRVLERFTAPPDELTAWIGPAIGPCCYEVGQDVADRVLASSSAAVASEGPRGRPHLDLVAAARGQLERKGVTAVYSVGVCTRCEASRLWSFRREGSGAGRNIAMIWQHQHRF